MPVEFKDYYKVLGVSSSANNDEIKKAFRAMARKYHPDVAKDKKSAEEKFKEVNEANEVLSNPESRKKYDQLGANWKTGGQSRPQPGQGGATRSTRSAGEEDVEFQFEGTGFSDFFEQFFGGGHARPRRGEGGFDINDAFSGVGSARQNTAQRGHDVEGDILISIEEVMRGAMRAISVRRTNARNGQEETQTYQVRVPSGVQEGQAIRVPGKGGEGISGGSAGDIFLRVRYAQHPDWTARGADLIGKLDLAPWEAVLGATVPVRTPDGSVSVKVPPGTQEGSQMRVRGKGLPNGGNRGDLYVEIAVQVPEAVSGEEQEIWKQLAAKSTFDPRKPAS